MRYGSLHLSSSGTSYPMLLLLKAVTWSLLGSKLNSFGRPWNSPIKFSAGVPSSTDLSWHLTNQIPQHWSVEVASVDLHSSQNLCRLGKSKYFPDLCTVLNEPSPLHLGVQVHGPILMQLMPKMSCMLHPGEIYPIQLQWGWVHWMLLPATDVQTFRFWLTWLWISWEGEIILLSKVFTFVQHLGRGTSTLLHGATSMSSSGDPAAL